MIRLIRAELLKIRTTNTWWLFGLGTLLFTGLALTLNCVQAHQALQSFDSFLKSRRGPNGGQVPPERLAELKAEWVAQHDVAGQAASILTSGQFFGVLFVSLLAILLITNEYQHQTATATYLTTPHRTSVVMAKLITGISAGVFFWLVTFGINVAVATIFLKGEGYGNQLDAWVVQRAVLLNLAVWAVFGIGFGALIRSQIGAVVTATLLYLLGFALSFPIFALIHVWIKKDWVLTAQVIVPAVASEVMISVTKLYPQSPKQWVGAAILIGYGVIAGLVGTLILRRRDVS
jgi:ABC-2 type transport system permease protein